MKEVTKRMENKVVLCGSCSSCPTVEVEKDKVRIGENENMVTLTREEWNIMVGKIQTGELKAL